MKILLKSLFKFKPDIDSPQFYIKFIVGLLFIALFWPAVMGGQRLWFIAKEGAPNEPIKIDLTKDDWQTAPKNGYLEISGYPGVQVARDSASGAVYQEYIDYKTYRNFYFSLHSDAAGKTPALAVVKRKYFLQGIFWRYFASAEKKIPPLVKGQPIAINGISGYHGEQMPDDVRQTLEANGVVTPADVIVLDERAGVPSLWLTLLFFIPATIAFLIGAYFLIPWVLLILGALWWLVRDIFKIGAIREVKK